MANNCLQTKLKVVVANDNLPILGTVVLNFYEVPNPNYVQRYFTLKAAEDLTFTVSGGSIVDGTGTPIGTSINYVATSGVQTYRVSNNDCKVLIPSKYSIQELTCRVGGYMDVSQLSACQNLYKLNMADSKTFGNISALPAKQYNDIVAESSSITGDISGITINNTLNIGTTAVAGIPSVTSNIVYFAVSESGVSLNLSSFANKSSLSTFTAEKTNVTGSINSLNNDVALTYLNLRYNSAITGSLEDFAESLWNAPNSKRNNLRLQIGGTKVTLNSQEYFSLNYTLHWLIFTNNGIELRSGSESGTVVASYNGSTWTYA